MQQYAAAGGLAESADSPQLSLDRLLISALYSKSEQPGEVPQPNHITLKNFLSKSSERRRRCGGRRRPAAQLRLIRLLITSLYNKAEQPGEVKSSCCCNHVAANAGALRLS